MKFEKLVNSLLEGFNIPPKAQTAVNSGPDIGMTSGDMQNTFPSKMDSIEIKLPKKKTKKLKKD
jgi:hypothetical protein